ncbi:MAG: cyclic pyranopterin monophosphate synthase MoaC [Planctomycetota bacterium]
MAQTPLTHVDPDGRSRMVDIGDKPVTRRTARAEAWVEVSPQLAQAIRDNALAKGSVLEVARLAGIAAAKRTDELIPLCHSLPLDAVDVDLSLEAEGVRIETRATTSWKTGVEMEALTAASVAALTVIDMGKAVDKGVVVRSIRLLEKTGGRSGDWTAPPTSPPPDGAHG